MLGFVIVGVEVNVEVQRRAEALNQRNCTGAGALLGVPGLPDQVCGDDAVENAEHPGSYAYFINSFQVIQIYYSGSPS
mgnify:FL=1